MIVKMIRSPGKRGGPCANECTHPSCLKKVHTATKTPCGVCGKPIGYSSPFCQFMQYATVHAECARRIQTNIRRRVFN